MPKMLMTYSGSAQIQLANNSNWNWFELTDSVDSQVEFELSPTHS